MSEPFLDDLGMLSGLQGQSRPRMPGIVDSDAREASLLAGR